MAHILYFTFLKLLLKICWTYQSVSYDGWMYISSFDAVDAFGAVIISVTINLYGGNGSEFFQAKCMLENISI